MNDKLSQGAPRRRRFYVDGQLQGRLTLALVLLEVALFGAACVYLYFALAAIIDDNLYVIHAAERADLLPQLARELGRVALVCGALNSIALLLTHGIWERHISRVLGALRKRLERVRALDLRPDSSIACEREQHRLLELCDGWMGAERGRVLAINDALSRLPRALPAQGGGERKRNALAALEEAAGHLQRRRAEVPRPQR